MGLRLAYAGRWRLRSQKRAERKWEDILAQLRVNDWGADEVCVQYPWRSGITATAADIWPRIQGPRGLWAMYHNAQVLVELADYAAAHGSGVEAELLHELRSDAFHIRLRVLSALAQYGLYSAGAGARVNALRAADLYSSLAARTTELLQANAAILVPRYVEAM
jgi:hypothetical protein